eukprot:CAMPEP_0118694754 /NCGR_PEP_ID=MMETSP0800-20121206/12745_1 /TAXON_ID=210618 ORGANISM="Striatella unipunctata, Strain CCMP2910" /NCGR_SAMPLE_ID=MMETSP0800 /ASSEMBLY_ACC=CAM_ASM_000638 /LENGTH=92 /DNA_ID=CAMNT_0006593347 /DNA_START=163 /DNA_END=441 /DNA_ORIENTATION=+
MESQKNQRTFTTNNNNNNKNNSSSKHTPLWDEEGDTDDNEEYDNTTTHNKIGILDPNDFSHEWKHGKVAQLLFCKQGNDMAPRVQVVYVSIQ